jgi:hypothetical protein
MVERERVARGFMAADDEVMSWYNNPEGHMDAYREPGAGYLREAEARYERWATLLREALDMPGAKRDKLRDAAYGVLSEGQ